MQSSSLAFVLSRRHFGSSGLSAAPAAISVSIMLLWGMTLATALARKDVWNKRRLREAKAGAGPLMHLT